MQLSRKNREGMFSFLTRITLWVIYGIMKGRNDCIKIIDNLRDFIAKNQYTEALRLYLQNIKQFGEEPELRNVGGDILGRMGKTSEAIGEYERCVELYRKRGLFANAIAICKKILRADPNCEDIYEILGDVYMEAGFLGEAILNYLENADRLRKTPGREMVKDVFSKLLKYFGEDNRILLQTLAGFPGLREEFKTYTREINSLSEQKSSDLIEMIKRDAEYGSFAKLVDMEIFRSKRYIRPFSIFAIEMHFNDVTKERRFEDLEKLFGILKNNLRTIDYVFLNATGFFYGLLPETPSDGVYLLSDRLVTRLKNLLEHKTNITMRWSTYPKDGKGIEELLLRLQSSGQVYFQ